MPRLKYQNYPIAVQDIQYLQIVAWQYLTMRETSLNANRSWNIRHISYVPQDEVKVKMFTFQDWVIKQKDA